MNDDGATFVALVHAAVEGATDYFSGRPRDRNPYSVWSAQDAHSAWLLGWDEAQMQLADRGQREASRWLNGEAA